MVRIVHAIAAAGVALAVAGAWRLDADDGPAAVAVLAPASVAPQPAEAADRPAVWNFGPSALAVAAAKVCAEGCDEQPAPAVLPSAVAMAAAVVQPVDFDAWALAPEPLTVVSAPAGVVRLFNTPPVPDEHDTTPADESDPYAAPVEPPAPE